MLSFFRPTYWFTMDPPQVGGLLGNAVFVLFVLCVVLGVIGHIVTDRHKKDRYVRQIGKRVSTLLVTMGMLGVALYFFSFEEIQLFGARFWYPVWIIAVMVWTLLIIRFVRIEIPRSQQQTQTRQAIAKYLPRKKAKKHHR
ncbi:hypothetical protein HYV70_01330 [Candidatus Uhrbacteria bacterium]|nr:hypothetical protein [Candidatus Uhrbacteria bacterium]